jgi:hypothetical protein
VSLWTYSANNRCTAALRCSSCSVRDNLVQGMERSNGSRTGVTAKMATPLSSDSELTEAQLESHGGPLRH